MRAIESIKQSVGSQIAKFRQINRLSKHVSRVNKRSSPKTVSKNDLVTMMGMNYQRFAHLLPYRYFDDENQLFINTESVGFALEISPLSGANEELINSLAEMIKNKIDPTVCVQVMLFGSDKIGPILKNVLSGYCGNDATFEALGVSQYNYLKHAALHGFYNKRKLDIPLRDYRCYLFINKRSGYNKSVIASLCDLRDEISTELKNSGIHTVIQNDSAFVSLVRNLINVDQDSIVNNAVKIDKYKELHEQVVDPSYSLRVFPTYLETQCDTLSNTIDTDEKPTINGRDVQRSNENKKNIVSLSLRELPSEVALWSQSDNFANIFRPSHSISCPFVISVHFKCESQEKSKVKAFRKASSLEKKANSPYAKLIPGTVDAAHDWKKVRDDLASESIQLCKVYYNCVLFTDEAHRREQTSDAISAFRVNGLDLYSIKYQQLQSYLAMMPFVAEQGLWEDLSMLGRLNTMTTWNLTNLLPIVADYKGSSDGSGFFAPTFRHQAACINNFDKNLDNYNCCIAATSGSGKSVLSQGMIASVLAQKGQVWVIDVGESYKKLCETLGGTYISASNLQLNPFSSISNIADSAESIRDLIAVMASPNEGLSDVQKAYLLKAVITAYERDANQANIDTVIDALESLMDHHSDRRIADMITLLEKYSLKRNSGASFTAKVFNEHSLLSMDDSTRSEIVVLEMSELEKQPELLKAVLFALILNIETQMYSGDRNRKKLCVIDEAWRLLKGSNKIACEFIEKGFRTARKNNGAFMVISQKINDFYMSDEAKAAWSCSENKIIMRQNSEEFSDFLKEQPDYFSDFETQIIKRFMESQKNGFSEFMVKQGNITSFHRFFLDPFSRVMYSSRAEEHQAIKDRVDAGMPVMEAIRDLAMELYGDEVLSIQNSVEEPQ